MPNSIDQMFQQKAQAQQATQQSAYPADIANFNLIPSKNKTSDRAPDFFGSTKINGAWFILSAWIVFSRSGTQMINTAMRPATEQEAARQEQQAQQYGQQQGQQQQQQQAPVQGFQQAQPQNGFNQPSQAFAANPMQSPQAQPQMAQAGGFGAQTGFGTVTAQHQPQQPQHQQPSPSNPLDEDVEVKQVVTHVDLSNDPPF